MFKKGQVVEVLPGRHPISRLCQKSKDKGEKITGVFLRISVLNEAAARVLVKGPVWERHIVDLDIPLRSHKEIEFSIPLECLKPFSQVYNSR